jgi:hypothetical protein
MQTSTGANTSAGGIAVIVVVMLAIGLFYVAACGRSSPRPASRAGTP